MELFKTLEDRILYVEALTCLATAEEKVSNFDKDFVYQIASNYGIPEEYVEGIWDKVKRKQNITTLLEALAEKDENIRVLLVQELIMISLLRDNYKDQKSKLLEICKKLNIRIKLEALKNFVQDKINQSKNNQ